jgi:hypothetical protein
MMVFAVDVFMKKKCINSEIITRHYLYGPEMESINCKVPKELQHLCLAEKLFIQRVSPLIPVIHIKKKV